MATGATQVKVAEQPVPQAGGTGVLVGVCLATLFAFILAMLNVAKSGPLFTEPNLLFGSLIFYAGSAALYIAYGVTGHDRYAKVASIFLLLAFGMNTGAAGHRWKITGHPPFASIYEMLLSFVWTVAALTLITERRFKMQLIGSVTAPLCVVGVTLMQLLPSDVHPLVPALQSTWLHVHVTLAMLSYAACALSFATAIMFLIKDNVKTETFLALTSLMPVSIYAGTLFTRFSGGGLKVAGYDIAEKTDIIISRGNPLFVVIPDLGWMFALALLAALAPLALYAMAKIQKRDELIATANSALFVSIAVQALVLGGFLLRARTGVYPVLNPPEPNITLAPTALAASPFILSGILTGIFASLLYLMLHWRRADLEKLLPSTDKLDTITYKTIGLAFPLLTLMIAAGAYWANRAWGSYWSWDPKETWAAITWLVYAGYLHGRLTRGWRGRKAAYFAIAGFLVVMFTFFGVTYLLPGLHAYA